MTGFRRRMRRRTATFGAFEEVAVTSDIQKELSDEAFRSIALGETCFRLPRLPYSAPKVCGAEGYRGVTLSA